MLQHNIELHRRNWFISHLTHTVRMQTQKLVFYILCLLSCCRQYVQKRSVWNSGLSELRFTSKKWSGAWNNIQLKSFYSTRAWVAGWIWYLTSKPLKVSVVSSIPTRDSFMFCWNFLKSLKVNFVQKRQKCQIFIFYEKLEWVGWQSLLTNCQVSFSDNF